MYIYKKKIIDRVNFISMGIWKFIRDICHLGGAMIHIRLTESGTVRFDTEECNVIGAISTLNFVRLYTSSWVTM